MSGGGGWGDIGSYWEEGWWGMLPRPERGEGGARLGGCREVENGGARLDGVWRGGKGERDWGGGGLWNDNDTVG